MLKVEVNGAKMGVNNSCREWNEVRIKKKFWGKFKGKKRQGNDTGRWRRRGRRSGKILWICYKYGVKYEEI